MVGLCQSYITLVHNRDFKKIVVEMGGEMNRGFVVELDTMILNGVYSAT